MAPQPGDDPQLSRRQYLAAGVTGVVGAVAGCTDAIDEVADELLEDVNLFNETERRLTGSIALTGPDETGRLDESFTLDVGDNNSNQTEDESNLAVYADVWTDTGQYGVTLELDEPVQGETSFSETVAINSPDEEMLMVPIGADEIDGAVDFRVGENFTETWTE